LNYCQQRGGLPKGGLFLSPLRGDAQNPDRVKGVPTPRALHSP
jgi:hypothetical protein